MTGTRGAPGFAREALEAARHALTALHGLHAHDGNPGHSWRLDESAVLGQIDAALARPAVCGVASASGPNGEPLACAWEPGHEGTHSWATLPTFAAKARPRRGPSGEETR